MLMQYATGCFCAGKGQSVPGSTFFECGMLISDGEESTFKE